MYKSLLSLLMVCKHFRLHKVGTNGAKTQPQSENKQKKQNKGHQVQCEDYYPGHGRSWRVRQGLKSKSPTESRSPVLGPNK